MSLNIDNFKGKTIKSIIYVDDEESCQGFNCRDELVDLEIMFTDNTSIKIRSISDDWIEVCTNNKDYLNEC